MTLVSAANNTGSDTEFILMKRSFIHIMSNRGPRIDLGKLHVSMYPSQRNIFSCIR
jgi:hypothetical protein